MSVSGAPASWWLTAGPPSQIQKTRAIFLMFDLQFMAGESRMPGQWRKAGAGGKVESLFNQDKNQENQIVRWEKKKKRLFPLLEKLDFVFISC